MRFLNFYESNDNTRTLPFKLDDNIKRNSIMAEKTLPPGFSLDDIGTVDQLINQEKKKGNEIDVDIRGNGAQFDGNFSHYLTRDNAFPLPHMPCVSCY